jgi:hypothetical protein
LAAQTLAAYRRDLTRYRTAMSARGRAGIGEVTTADVAAFLAGLRQGGDGHPPLAASSAARAVAAVRGLHAFAAREGLAETDAAREVHPPTPARRLPRAIGIAEVERLIATAAAGGEAGDPLPLRDRALLELLYGTGARISEAVGLDVDDLDGVAGPGPAERGADLIAAPVNWPAMPVPAGERPADVVRVQAEASMNRVFIAVADRCRPERGVSWVGGTVIVGPDGYPLAGPVVADRSAVLVAPCDLAQARDKRVSTHNDVLTDRRPALYRPVAQ